ncbi:MAG: hypothetical protein MZV70_49980 [Desulfobacterales bacterium]|nr:hypothetical protein [Desulfobacterales bacterium]
MIDLGIGQPSPWLLPVEAIAEAAAALQPAAPGACCWPTAPSRAMRHFRTALSGFLEGIYGVPVDPAHLLVTNGASQAHRSDLHAVQPGGRHHLRRGADLLPGAQDLRRPPPEAGRLADGRGWADHRGRGGGAQAFAAGIPLHHPDLPQPDQRLPFRRPARTAGGAEPAPRPDWSWPTRSTTRSPTPRSRRPRWRPSAPRPVIISLGSFSKILAPGLRLGWLQAAPDGDRAHRPVRASRQRRRCEPFTSGVVRSAMELGLVDENLALLKDTYSRRMQAMCAALRSRLPASVRFTEPAGGFFIWLALPEGMDTADLLRQSHRAERGIHAGPASSPAGRG